MKKEEFEILTNKLRIDALEMVYNAGSGHLGGSFSITDILTYIYYIDSNIKDSINEYKEVFMQKEFKDLTKERLNIDKVIMSKAHASPALYSILLSLGAIPAKELYSFRRIEGILEGHVSKKASNFIDYSGGSLGQGLSFANGIAKSFKYIEEKSKENGIDLQKRKIYVIAGDGELDEGQNYEAMLLASKLKLDNICFIIDRNKIQLDGTTNEILPLEPLEDKLKCFGFNTVKIDGHDFNSIEEAFSKYSENFGSGKPFAIIAETVKGKGVSFMENTAKWHGKAPNREEYEEAIIELGGFKNV